MAWRDLTWDGCDPPIEPTRLAQVETVLGVRFPVDFRECARECHGGTPSKQDFVVPARDLEFGSCVGILLSFDEQNPENILETCAMLADQIPPGLIPFATDGGGDYVCFDYRDDSKSSPPIVYWHASGSPGNELTPLASNFSGFTEMLS